MGFGSEPPTLAVDFDGTLSRHSHYPEVGEPIPLGIAYCHNFIDRGGRVIIWTVRSEIGMDKAVDWLIKQKLYDKLYGININPSQAEYSTSPKINAHAFVDDLAIGCPVIPDIKYPFADWSIIIPLLEDRWQNFGFIRSGVLKPFKTIIDCT